MLPGSEVVVWPWEGVEDRGTELFEGTMECVVCDASCDFVCSAEPRSREKQVKRVLFWRVECKF